MILKKTFILAAFIAVLLPSPGFPASSEHKVLFEKAKFTMETKGDLEGAIKLFNEIIEKYPDEREYAAKSQLYIGLCYEKSGLKEAQRAYRKVVDSYPEQTEAVKLANEKLSLLLRAEAVIRKEDKKFNIRQVWAGPGVDLEGAPSPDGRYLSYVDWDSGDLAIYELATGKKSHLTNDGSWDEPIEYTECSRWSPDGKQIVYDWYNENGFIELRLIGLDGSKPRILYRNEKVEWAKTYDWSPDGKQILACFWRKDDINKIVLVSAADGSVRVVKTLDRWPGNMCFSPDGRYIVYDFPQKEDSPDRDIFLLSTDRSREIPLIKHPANDVVLGWAPDGKNILFASDRTGTPDIWVIRVTEGNPQGVPRLVKSSKGPFSPSGLGFTMDGSFYYGHRPNKTDVYITEIDPETGKIMVPPHEAINRFVESNATPDYSPDGKYLAYISRRPPMTMRYTTRPIGNVLCIRSLETGEVREFKPEINRFGWPRWSPDGLSVLVVNWNAKDQKGYYQIDTQTGKVTPVLPANEDRNLFGRHEWSRDGKTIFYGCRDRKDKIIYQIFVRDLESGTEKLLYRSDDRLNISLSPDGQWLAILFLSREKPCLKVMPAAGGEPRELCRFEEEEGIVFGGNCSITWTADGKYILFTMKNYKMDDAKWELCRISADGGEPEKLGLEMSDFVILSVHPDGRHIAFSSRGQSGSEVWVMENFLPEEKEDKAFNIRKVWAGHDVDTYGAPSPDGRYISYVDWEATDLNHNDLAIYEIATGKKRRLTDNASWYESGEYQFALSSIWSPDGKQIAYQWWSNLIELCVIGLDGSKPRILYSSEEKEWVKPYDWTPDGGQILACITVKDGENKIVLVSAADGSVRVLKTLDKYYGTKLSSWYTPENMSFSPDGRFIVYDFPKKEDYQDRDIYLMSTDGSREFTLVEHPAHEYVLGWAPDGKNILFASDRTGTMGVWLIAVADGKPQGTPKLVKPDIGRFHPMGFTQKGSFYYGISQGRTDIYIAELDPETGKILVPPKKAIKRFEGSNIASDYSPDGKYLAYISDRGRRNVLCIRSLETGQEREFSLNLNLIVRAWRPRWSPDCRSILVSGEDNKDRSGIYKIDVQTGDFTYIVMSGSEISTYSGEWSHDGKAIFYVRYDSKAKINQIIVRDIETGKEKELYRSSSYGLSNISLSPDGQWLALRGRSDINNIRIRSLKVMPVTGGEPRELYRFEKMGIVEKTITWTADGKYILFAWEEEPAINLRELYRIPAEGGEIEKLGLKMLRISNLRVHPDGRHIAFSSHGSAVKPAEIWVMENFLPE